MLSKENINTNIIINLTNDSWFGKISGPYQHFYFTKLRASEFNKTIIRVSSNGISGIIDNYGKIFGYTKLNQSATKVFKIKLAAPQLNYVKFHKFFIIFIFLLIIVCIKIDKKNES